MTISFAGYYSFKFRQLTGIPLSRICEGACEIPYDTLPKELDLLQETITKRPLNPFRLTSPKSCGNKAKNVKPGINVPFPRALF